MEFLSDQTGSVTFGWVSRGVYYARFTGALSARVGAEHNRRLQEAIESCSTVRYFSDSSELKTYDLLARSAFVRLVLTHRKKFADIVILTWAEGVSAATQAFSAAIGEPIAVLTSSAEFERRLLMAAPRASGLLKVDPTARDSSRRATPSRAPRSLTPSPGQPPTRRPK